MMARVLIVEDSPEQARLIAGLLESAGFDAAIASNGAEALEVIEAVAPDVVTTDLIMPGLNGLELVEAVCSRHPLIPVILMTAFGSGEIALRALQKGAASYVPKRRLQQELVRTVEKTLHVAQAKREQERVLECMRTAAYCFELENDEVLIPPLVRFIQDAVRARMKRCDENQLIQLGIAMQEALLNAMHHGNLGVDSQLREGDGEAYTELIERRRLDPTYGERRVHFNAELTPSELCCIVRDEGAGFDPKQVPDPTDPSNLEKVCGRGLYLIWTFMDRVAHNENGNEITLVKNLAHAEEAS